MANANIFLQAMDSEARVDLMVAAASMHHEKGLSLPQEIIDIALEQIAALDRNELPAPVATDRKVAFGAASTILHAETFRSPAST